MFDFLAKTVSRIAKGQVQRNLGLQSPALPSSLTRIGRFLYIGTGSWVTLCWYTGYVNKHTPPGSGPTFVLPGLGGPVVAGPSRDDPGLKTGIGGSGGSASQVSVDAGDVTGIRAQIVAVAQNAVSQERRNPNSFYYVFGGPDGRGGKMNITDYPIHTDCSGFVRLVYKAAGAPDPCGSNYQGSACSSTYEMSKGKTVRADGSAAGAKPGDLVFFPDHVAVYVGNGACVSHGSPGGPRLVTVAAEAAYESRGTLGYRSYL